MTARHSAPRYLVLGAEPLAAVVTDCERRRPDEACGMLAGRFIETGVVVERVTPLDNVWPVVAERTTRYAVDPLRQMLAEREAEAAGLSVVGYYHSHPAGEPVPSAVDRGLAWPGYVYLIVGFVPAALGRAWTLVGEAFEEVAIIEAEAAAASTGNDGRRDV